MAEILKTGTVLADPAVPGSPDAATHYPEYGVGGWQTGRATIAERDAITLQRRQWWMVVPTDDGKKWELVPGLVNEDLSDNRNWREWAVTLPFILDIYEVPQDIRQAVVNGNYTGRALNNPQPAGSKPGMWFGQGNYEYVFRPDADLGTNAWFRIGGGIATSPALATRDVFEPTHLSAAQWQAKREAVVAANAPYFRDPDQDVLLLGCEFDDFVSNYCFKAVIKPMPNGTSAEVWWRRQEVA